ncbi:hypothetical protein BDW22DRAFT_1428054 [Trametopsis cervina]|nr:hypothetical protein BDW22DRAFT_1428054 [Trametopsis cervina]
MPRKGVGTTELSVDYASCPLSQGTTRTLWPDIFIRIGDIRNRLHWKTFCEHVATEDLVDLTVEDETCTSAEKWRYWRYATGLRRLRVIGSAIFTLLPLLYLDLAPGLDNLDDSESSFVSHSVLFPQLEEISIIERAQSVGQLGEVEFTASELLLLCLRARRERGTPIRNLKLPARFLNTMLAGELTHEVENVRGSSIHYH